VSWTTPGGMFSDSMECVFVDGGLPVARWVGEGWPVGAKRAGRLDVVGELSGQGAVVDELVVIALGVWWYRLQVRNATGGIVGV
jgi:hypothetical protein